MCPRLTTRNSGMRKSRSMAWLGARTASFMSTRTTAPSEPIEVSSPALPSRSNPRNFHCPSAARLKTRSSPTTRNSFHARFFSKAANRLIANSDRGKRNSASPASVAAMRRSSKISRGPACVHWLVRCPIVTFLCSCADSQPSTRFGLSASHGNASWAIATITAAEITTVTNAACTKKRSLRRRRRNAVIADRRRWPRGRLKPSSATQRQSRQFVRARRHRTAPANNVPRAGSG